jgi:hypothetical protein
MGFFSVYHQLLLLSRCAGLHDYHETLIGGPSSTLGNTGTRSTVYASAEDAVNTLLALGITPAS